MADAPNLSNDQCDVTLATAQHFAQQAFLWGRRSFPGDPDAAMAVAMAMMVQAVGHCAAQCTGATDDPARVAEAGNIAAEQVRESTASQHRVLMLARAAAQGEG